MVFIEPIQVDEQFTQELQLLSPSGGPFTWMIGAYYFHSKGDYAPLDVNLPLGDPGTGLPPAVLRTTSTQKASSIAGFGQATYEIATGTKITLGGRYTSEKRSLSGITNIYPLQQRMVRRGR